jgi:hypothetical protein
MENIPKGPCEAAVGAAELLIEIRIPLDPNFFWSTFCRVSSA